MYQIADLQTRKMLGPNARGELLMRGPQVMLGYFNNTQATLATIDHEGWLHTGFILIIKPEPTLLLWHH